MVHRDPLGTVVIVDAKLDDTFAVLSEKVAAELRLLPCELRFCRGGRTLGREDQHRTLVELGLGGAGPSGSLPPSAAVLTLLRVPRLTLEVLQGTWVNSRGAKIRVEGDEANVSGLVTRPVALDNNGTVTAVGDARVATISGVDEINFHGDTWWRVREHTGSIAVTLRTVGGAVRRVDDLRPHNTLGDLRARAVEELCEELPRSAASLAMHSQDMRTLAELGVRDGDSLLCAR